MIIIIPEPTETFKENLKRSDDVIVVDDKQKDTIIKGLRLVLLVGNDGESSKAAKLLDILLPKEQ